MKHDYITPVVVDKEKYFDILYKINMSKETFPLKRKIAHISELRGESKREVEEQILDLLGKGNSKQKIYRLLTSGFGTPKSHYSEVFLSFNNHKKDKHK